MSTDLGVAPAPTLGGADRVEVFGCLAKVGESMFGAVPCGRRQVTSPWEGRADDRGKRRYSARSRWIDFGMSTVVIGVQPGRISVE